MTISLPSWHRAYMLFRFGDGVTHALIPLMPLLRYDLPLWTVPAVVAAMNLVTVPATFLWGSLMERYRGHGRRRLALGGFAMSAIAMAIISWGPSFPVFVAASAAYTAFGVATAPAASVLLLEAVPSREWGRATGLLSQRTGYAYVAGILATMTAGLTGHLSPRPAFVIGAVATLAAAVVARQTIVPAGGPTLSASTQKTDLDVVRAGQRRFERPVWFPGRLRFAPTFKGIALANGHPFVFLVAYFLIFAGSAMFFSSYTGVLRDTVGLSLGLVLLAQMPSNFTTPLTHPWAGRYGAERSEIKGARYGAMIRLAALPAMALVLLFWFPGAMFLVLILHGIIGISFALLQVNGSCLMAKVHRGGRGAGVGNFHAAVSLGGLVGSVLAALALAFLPLAAVYVAVTVTLVAGTMALLSVQHSPQFEPRNL